MISSYIFPIIQNPESKIKNQKANKNRFYTCAGVFDPLALSFSSKISLWQKGLLSRIQGPQRIKAKGMGMQAKLTNARREVAQETPRDS